MGGRPRDVDDRLRRVRAALFGTTDFAGLFIERTRRAVAELVRETSVSGLPHILLQSPSLLINDLVFLRFVNSLHGSEPSLTDLEQAGCTPVPIGTGGGMSYQHGKYYVSIAVHETRCCDKLALAELLRQLTATPPLQVTGKPCRHIIRIIAPKSLTRGVCTMLKNVMETAHGTTLIVVSCPTPLPTLMSAACCLSCVADLSACARACGSLLLAPDLPPWFDIVCDDPIADRVAVSGQARAVQQRLAHLRTSVHALLCTPAGSMAALHDFASHFITTSLSVRILCRLVLLCAAEEGAASDSMMRSIAIACAHAEHISHLSNKTAYCVTQLLCTARQALLLQ